MAFGVLDVAEGEQQHLGALRIEVRGEMALVARAAHLREVVGEQGDDLPRLDRHVGEDEDAGLPCVHPMSSPQRCCQRACQAGSSAAGMGREMK